VESGVSFVCWARTALGVIEFVRPHSLTVRHISRTLNNYN
jgi:hypothetical protein